MSTPATPEAAVTHLNQMERVEPQTTPEPAPEPAPLNVEDEAAVQAALEANAVQVPDGESLVPSSDVGKVGQAYRAQIKELKGKIAEAEKGSAEARSLKEQVQQLQQTVEQLKPYVQAYQQIQQQPAQTPAPPEVSDDEADNYARLYDLYTADGSGQLDRDRGRRIVTDMRRMAKEAAKEAAHAEVAPIHQMSVSQLSKNNFARAINTALPNGARASEAALRSVWDQLDPSVTATVEGAREAFLAAVGRTYAISTAEELAALHNPSKAQRGPDGKFVSQQAAPVPEAIPRETSGGQPPQAQTALTEQERKFIAATGMSEADYLKTASNRFGAR